MIAPFIEVKDVILCRSGYQIYTRQELTTIGFPVDSLPVKDEYIEYRAPSMVVRSKDLFKRLPLTQEHPYEWVTSDNWEKLAGGTTGETVDVVALDDDEIALKSSATFYKKSLHDYYLKGNKEVSVGYIATREVANHTDYDIIMTGIKEVNHCAVTQAGRGGSSVAILDSIIGGFKTMKTGLFHFLKRKGKTEDSQASLSTLVYASLDEAKGKEGAELEKVVSKVFDSVILLKDCEDKDLLKDMVRDTFTNPAEAIANKEDVCSVLDSVYAKVSAASVQEITKVLDSTEKVEDTKVSDAKTEDTKVSDAKTEEAKVEDTDGKGSNTNNVADSEEEKEKEKEKVAVKDSITPVLDSAVLRAIVSEELKAILVGSKKDNIQSSVLDSKQVDVLPANIQEIADAIF